MSAIAKPLDATGGKRPLRVLYVVHNHPTLHPGGAEAYALELYEAMRESPDVEPSCWRGSGPTSPAQRVAHPGTPFSSVNGDPNQYFVFTETDALRLLHADLPRQDPLHAAPRRLPARRTGPTSSTSSTPSSSASTCSARSAASCPTRRSSTRCTSSCRSATATARWCGPSATSSAAKPRRGAATSASRRSASSPSSCASASSSRTSTTSTCSSPRASSAGALPRLGHRAGADRGSRSTAAVRRASRAPAPQQTEAPRNPSASSASSATSRACKVLLEAMALLDERRRRAPLAARRQPRAAAAGVPGRVRARCTRRCGRARHLRAARTTTASCRSLMADLHWVLVPSIWWENSPLVIQEAFFHGRPVICSDVGGMAEKVTRRRRRAPLPGRRPAQPGAARSKRRSTNARAVGLAARRHPRALRDGRPRRTPARRCTANLIEQRKGVTAHA